MRRELNDIVAARPLTTEELALAQGDLTRSLPGQWETNTAVASTLAEMVAYGLPDGYYDTYAGRIGALTTVDLARAAHTVVQPGVMTWVVMGDRSKIEAGLAAQGLQIRHIDADGHPVA